MSWWAASGSYVANGFFSTFFATVIPIGKTRGYFLL